MAILPVVERETGITLAEIFAKKPINNADINKQLRQIVVEENPHIVEFIELYSGTTNDPDAVVFCGLWIYCMLKFQVEVENKAQEEAERLKKDKFKK